MIRSEVSILPMPITDGEEPVVLDVAKILVVERSILVLLLRFPWDVPSLSSTRKDRDNIREGSVQKLRLLSWVARDSLLDRALRSRRTKDGCALWSGRFLLGRAFLLGVFDLPHVNKLHLRLLLLMVRLLMLPPRMRSLFLPHNVMSVRDQ